MKITKSQLRQIIKEVVESTAITPYEGAEAEIVNDDWTYELDNEMSSALHQATAGIIEEIVEQVDENTPGGLSPNEKNMISENALTYFYGALDLIMDDIRSGQLGKNTEED